MIVRHSGVEKCFDKLENNNVIEINNHLKELGEPIRLFEYQQDLTSFLTKFADLDINCFCNFEVILKEEVIV